MGILGTTEILMLLAVTLIVFGPNRLPELARHIAKFTKMFRNASMELQQQLNVDDWDLEKPVRKSSKPKNTVSTTDDDETYTYPYEDVYDEEFDEGYGYVDSNDPSSDPYSDNHKDREHRTPVSTRNSSELTVDEPAKTQDAERFNRELLT